jgi:DNA polymerase III subunit alpha
VYDFVHLHVHSAYSLRQGALTLEDIVNLAKEGQMRAVALTDTNALYGVIPFYKLAKQAGIKPIIGVQLSVCKDEDREAMEERRRANVFVDTVVLLAKNLEGYEAIVSLVTLSHQKRHHPFVTFGELAAHTTNTIALIGGGESCLVQMLANRESDKAREWLSIWQNVCPSGNLYLDVQDHKIPEERSVLPMLLKAARDNDIPLVATNDVHYKSGEDASVQRVLAQLEGNAPPKILASDMYDFASAEEMARRFTNLPEATLNTCVIADMCNLELPLSKTLLPKYPTQNSEPAEEVLQRAAKAGVMMRYGHLTTEIEKRLDYELGIINQLGFADYFLVVADFIRYAHKKGISTGPGRGSAAGSLVAYALRITDVDPLQNHLLFERFLNPERVSWPDIDTDFEFERRGEVIQYVKERYGKDYVAQIGTFGTLAARAAIRDAGRVLQTDPKLVDRLARMVPGYPGVTLHRAWDEVAGIRDLIANNHHAKNVWEMASKMEGLPRHTSVHAAGVVISPIPLHRIVPVEPGSDGMNVTQYPMEDIESIGLVKMDFLGLKTLTLIDECVNSIKRRTGRQIDLRTILPNDVRTFKMLSRGETLGCFQLESTGMRRVLRDLKPTHLEDIIAVNALYRPGPMENIPAFIAAKHGRQKVVYPHPDLKPILEDTYGVIVYQEQIMQIASLMAGFTLGQADLLRRAVSKKKRDVLVAERGRFVAGCLAKGYELETANEVYDLIVRFADYGFNRSHAAAYAVLSYRTSYLRANYLPDFLAALLTLVMGSTDKISEYVRDARAHGIRVLPPSITTSQRGFIVESDTEIRTGLLSIKGVGVAAVDAILLERQKNQFTSLTDFLTRINGRICNRKVVESLLLSGAFSDFLPPKISKDAAAEMLSLAYVEAEEHKQFAGLGLLLDEPRIEAEPSKNTSPQVLFIRYPGGKQGKDMLSKVKQILTMDKGEVSVALFDASTRRTRILGDKWKVAISTELLASLEEIVGIGNVKVGKTTNLA